MLILLLFTLTRITSGLSLSFASDSNLINGSWIYSNQESTDSCKHAGFLLAQGLLGHLKNMFSWHSYSYLLPKHQLTTIGLMLGLGASYCGTMDPLVTKLLCVHIPSLLPTSNNELNTSLLVQTSSIFGIGLTFMESGNLPLIEKLILEIGRGSEIIEDCDEKELIQGFYLK